MTWFWLNIPFGMVFFLAMAGIPLWMVIRHPDRRPVSADAAGRGAIAQAGTVAVAEITDWPTVAAEISDRRELVGVAAGDSG